MTPKISMLLPVYNKAPLVGFCLHSLLDQKYPDFEVVVYDDGSTDNSVAEVEAIRDPRLRVIRGDSNRGVSYARNRLMEAATGEWIAFQDADDASNIHRLAVQMAAIERTGRMRCMVPQVKTSACQSMPWTEWIDVAEASCGGRGTVCSMMLPARPIIYQCEDMKLGAEVVWLKDTKLVYGGAAYVSAPLYYHYIGHGVERTVDHWEDDQGWVARACGALGRELAAHRVNRLRCLRQGCEARLVARRDEYKDFRVRCKYRDPEACAECAAAIGVRAKKIAEVNC